MARPLGPVASLARTLRAITRSRSLPKHGGQVMHAGATCAPCRLAATLACAAGGRAGALLELELALVGDVGDGGLTLAIERGLEAHVAQAALAGVGEARVGLVERGERAELARGEHAHAHLGHA